MTATTSTSPSWNVRIAGPGVKTVAGENFAFLIQDYNKPGLAVTYQVATAGTYYIVVYTQSSGTAYQLQVTAEGTPIGVPNPAQKGCVTGQVDYILYSLQLIAAKLPDEVSVGGTKLCASCDIKPPAYPELVEKMEKSMAMNLNVSACYDASGNIFQLKLIHP